MIEIHWIECFKKTKILFIEHRFIYFWFLFIETKGKFGSVRKHVFFITVKDYIVKKHVSRNIEMYSQICQSKECWYKR